MEKKWGPLFPRDQGMILSYMSDLRILCSHFRNVHNNLMRVVVDQERRGQLVSDRNTIFRRWMVARCVLARLELSIASVTDLIDQRTLQALDFQRDAHAEERDAFRDSLDTVTQERDDARNALAPVTQERDDARNALAHVTQERDTAREALAQMQARIEQMDMAIAQLETDLTQARGEARNVRLRRDGGHQGGKKNNKKKTKRRRRKRKKTRRRR